MKITRRSKRRQKPKRKRNYIYRFIKEVEIKCKTRTSTVEIGALGVNGGVLVASIPEIDPGTKIDERIGDTIYAMAVNIRGKIFGQTFVEYNDLAPSLGLKYLIPFSSGFIKVVLILDKQPNNELVGWYDVFEQQFSSDSPLEFQIISDTQRFKILNTETIHVDTTVTASVATAFPAVGDLVTHTIYTRPGFYKYFEINHNFEVPLPIEFREQTDIGTDITTNNIILLYAAEGNWVTSAMEAEFGFDSIRLAYRFRFKDH